MKLLFISLGCDKNLVDSEVMLGMLTQKGYEITDDEEQADAVVINTCCFIGDAKEESINTILEMGKRRVSGQLKEALRKAENELGTTATEKIVETLEKVLEGRPENYLEDLDKKPVGGKKRVLTTGGYYDYLKIAEGCDKHCTYCIIPKVRGNYRSAP